MTLRMQHMQQNSPGNEGFVLVAALLVLLVLTIIGIIATANTSTELQIAANDKIYKETFYRAEAGLSLGTELLEQNLACATGFQGSGSVLLEGAIRVQEQKKNRLAFWANGPLDPNLKPADAGEGQRVIGRTVDADVVFPVQTNSDSAVQAGVGHLYIGGQSEPVFGGGLEMAAGYEGRGKGASQGGAVRVYDLYSQYSGPGQSEVILLQGWWHVVGMEGSCLY